MGDQSTTKLLPLGSIKIDGGTQPRCEIDQSLVAEYAEAMEEESTEFPPVIVFNDGAEVWLADGFHRYHAARMAGLTGITCSVRKGTLRDAVLFSVGANSEHGKRRTNADKRKAVTVLLRDSKWSKWSDREIAKRCGVANSFVSDLRKSLFSENSDFPSTSQEERKVKFIPRFGPASTMNVSNIGKRKHQTNCPASASSSQQVSDAFRFAEIAKTNLQCIRLDDPNRTDALSYVRDWINSQLS